MTPWPDPRERATPSVHTQKGDPTALCCKAAPGENAELVASDPVRFYLPSYVGPKGWVSLRLDLGEVDWGEAAELVLDSYRLVAPRRLAALADQAGPITRRSGRR
jgi:YjbR